MNKKHRTSNNMHQSLHLCSKEMASHVRIWLTTLCFVVTIWSFIPIFGWLQTFVGLILASLGMHIHVNLTYMWFARQQIPKHNPILQHLPYLPKNDTEALILVPLTTLLLCHILHLSLHLQLPFLLSRVHLYNRPILALTKGCQIIGNLRGIQMNEVVCGTRYGTQGGMTIGHCFDKHARIVKEHCE